MAIIVAVLSNILLARELLDVMLRSSLAGTRRV